MEFVEISGYGLAIIVGLAIGLIGGGGSVLSIPILVYLLGVEAEQTAPAYSLFIVGVVSLIGVIQKYKDKLVDVRTAIVFGIPSILAVYFTRKYVVQIIPDEIYFLNISLSKRLLVMGLFAVLMILASFSMILGRKDNPSNQKRTYNYPLILLEGALVGFLTGLVGAGGGFLIIPALVKLSKIPMKIAVGTSLMIISSKSLIGFIGDVQNITINWTLLIVFTSLAVFGIFIGNQLSKKIDGSKLKKGFGWFVLIAGIYILLKETIFKNQ